MICIICALTENRAIGRNNQLLFHLSADLQRFKALTTGHTIIMGRRTYESLPKGALPHRRNIVLSRRSDFSAPGVEVFSSLTDALEACDSDDDIFIIGGESVYAEALPLADCLYLTLIKAVVDDADAFFPPYEKDGWQLTTEESHTADEKNAVDYCFANYLRHPAFP